MSFTFSDLGGKSLWQQRLVNNGYIDSEGKRTILQQYLANNRGTPTYNIPDYAINKVPFNWESSPQYSIPVYAQKVDFSSPAYDVPSYAQKVNLSPEYNMPSYAKSPISSKVPVRVARSQSQESFVPPSPQYDMPSYARSETYQYNPKTTQASREGYQQYVDAVNAWDKQKATPEQQYVNNFINSYDQYQRIRNGWR